MCVYGIYNRPALYIPYIYICVVYTEIFVWYTDRVWHIHNSHKCHLLSIFIKCIQVSLITFSVFFPFNSFNIHIAVAATISIISAWQIGHSPEYAKIPVNEDQPLNSVIRKLVSSLAMNESICRPVPFGCAGCWSNRE